MELHNTNMWSHTRKTETFHKAELSSASEKKKKFLGWSDINLFAHR